MRRSIIISLLVLLAFPGLAQAAAALDQASSRISSEKTELKADGIANTKVTVTAKDTNLMPMEGKKVVLTSSRGKLDWITVQTDVTDSLGKAYFLVSSLKNGTSVYTATIDGTVLQRTVTITYSGGLNWDLKSGDLIKIPDDNNVLTLSDTAVYYYGADGRRYVFPNEKAYYTWYRDFSSVKTIPVDQMSLIPMGSNITYKAGSKLVKFQTDTKTYLPTKGGVLRWVKTETVARGLFGNDWSNIVDDISEAFYINYKFGTPIESALDAPLDILRSGDPTINVDKGLE
ncbi:Ig-like domain-containing protein [Candidatus Uhrbacteria bacterium]|nr:Ig-like domain-containing protein [Candidatus Uhrbacteria bacterium]